MTVTNVSTPILATSTKSSDANFSKEKSENESAIASHVNGEIKKYDFTNITRSEFKDIINGLIQTGEMSLDESSSLLYAMSDQSITKNFGTQMNNESVDVFLILIQSITFNQSIGNDSGILYDTKAFNALMRFQSKPYEIDINV